MEVRDLENSKNEILSRYKRQREQYLKAEEAVLNAQSYSIGSRTLTRADLGDIASRIEYLDHRIDTLERTGGKRKTFRVIPRDI